MHHRSPGQLTGSPNHASLLCVVRLRRGHVLERWTGRQGGATQTTSVAWSLRLVYQNTPFNRLGIWRHLGAHPGSHTLLAGTHAGTVHAPRKLFTSALSFTRLLLDTRRTQKTPGYRTTDLMGRPPATTKGSMFTAKSVSKGSLGTRRTPHRKTDVIRPAAPLHSNNDGCGQATKIRGGM